MRAFSSALKSVDLRAHPREQVNRQAKVIDGPFAVEALIKNISIGGAMLNFPGRQASGESFVMVDVETATAYVCRVSWRKGAECGVRFVKSQDLRGLVPGQFDMARRVWHVASR
jgi:hypothetical protein